MLRLLLLSASYAPLAPILITLRLTDVPLSVKFGALRDPAGAFVGFDARPAAIKNFLAYSLRRLGTDIDLYQPARVDRTMPIEDIVGAIAELVRAGYVGHTGLSEASAVTVRRAHAVHPIAALEIDFSLVERGIEAEGAADRAGAWHRAGRLWRPIQRSALRPPSLGGGFPPW
jgi:aryl-alcohol dehydrogenase-like predicted oxidoreductase